MSAGRPCPGVLRGFIDPCGPADVRGDVVGDLVLRDLRDEDWRLNWPR